MHFLTRFALGLALTMGLQPVFVQAATTINALNKNAYGANGGWIDFRGNTNNGAVIGEFVCPNCSALSRR